MARSQVELSIKEAGWKAADQLLARLEIAVRGKTINDAMRKVGNDIKQRTRAILPKPGYPGDRPDMKPLRETLKVKVKDFNGGAIKVMVVGYTYSRPPNEGQGGNHGHLLEGGHDIVKGGPKKKGGRVVGHVPAHEYMVKIVETTRTQQQTILVTAITSALKKV
jgi:hypothetical protein